MSSAGPKDPATTGLTAGGLPVIPATTPHAHTAITLRINIEAAYAKAGLIEVLRGGIPPKADEIVVVPMDDIPQPPAHRTMARTPGCMWSPLRQNQELASSVDPNRLLRWCSYSDFTRRAFFL